MKRRLWVSIAFVALGLACDSDAAAPAKAEPVNTKEPAAEAEAAATTEAATAEAPTTAVAPSADGADAQTAGAAMGESTAETGTTGGEAPAAVDLTGLGTIGVEFCDKYISSYRTCIETKVPAADQAKHASTLSEEVGHWARTAKAGDAAKSALEIGCRSAQAAAARDTRPLGCEW